MGQESPVVEDEFKLSLELSIGGCYANAGNKNLEREKGKGNENIIGDISRSVFCDGDNKNGRCEFPDLQRKRESQTLKRREARIKQEVGKPRGMGDGGFVELFHEERDGIPVPAAKREKIVAEKLNTSSYGENKKQMQAQLLLPVGSGWVVPLWGSNYVVAGERDGNSSGDEPVNACSSVVSHHRSTCTSTSHKGWSSDSGSRSSSFGSDKVEAGIQPSTTALSKSNNAPTTRPTVTAVNTTPPPPSTPNIPTHMMPCVSATGTKTITGVLYKYTKSEVTIMCVCHGSFFSPAQFLLHAGAIDVTHPLRHITVLPSSR